MVRELTGEISTQSVLLRSRWITKDIRRSVLIESVHTNTNPYHRTTSWISFLMSRDRRLILYSSLLGIIGALFMAKGVFGMSPDVMAKLSSTYLDFNQFDVENLASQKADLLVGVILVLIAFGVSMWSFRFPDTESLSKIVGPYWPTLFRAILMSLLIACLACWANHELRLKFILETQQVLNEENIPEER